MQNIQKKKKQYFKNFLYKRVESGLHITPMYVVIVLLNIVGDAFPIYEYTSSQNSLYINLGVHAFLYIQITLLAIFVILTALSIFNNFFSSVWMYYLLFLEAMTSVYVRSVGTCFSVPCNGLCKDDLAMKIVHVAILVLFCIIVVVFKNFAYYPFQDVTNLFSMGQEHITMYLLGFRVFLGLTMYHDIFQTIESEIKMIIILSFLLFWKSRNSGYNHQISKKIWDIYFYFTGWTGLSLFVAYHLNYIQNAADTSNSTPELSFQNRFFLFWGYTFPFVIMIPIFYDISYAKGRNWKSIFETDDHQLARVHGKQNVFIICSHFYNKLEEIRKSEMKYRDPEFKNLCSLIRKHMGKCLYHSCSLHQLHELKVDSADEFLQQKKFIKTISCSIEYIRIILEKLKQIEPHNIQNNIEIAHFYLLALKNKQKGMSLYNQINTKKVKVRQRETQFQAQNNNKNGQELQNKKVKQSAMEEKTKLLNEQISFSNKYAVYYLKKKIDNIFVGQQKQSQSNVDNQISQFRQKIQVSVTMLAEFWSLLADPKCNLKKLYDLTNILFPLKVSLQKDWQKIKLFKNIQCYNLYAKYLIKMFNDKEKGIKILDEAKKIDYQLRNKQQIELDDKGGQILQQIGIIFMQFDGKNSGVMFQVNINAQKLFGYSKGELQNKKVNDIMPEIYATEHDKVLENYQQTNYSTMMNKERQIWGKSKNGFLFPFTILIKPILSFYSQSSSSQVYASIKKQTYIRETIGIVLDTKENVQQFSSTALRVFPVLIQKYRQRTKGKNHFVRQKKGSDKNISPFDFNIRQILPDFDQIKQKVLVDNQQYEMNINRSVGASKYNPGVFLQQSLYNIQISQITLKTCGKIGYIIKLTKMGNSTYQAKPVQKQQTLMKGEKPEKDFLKSLGIITKQDSLTAEKKNKLDLNKQRDNKVKFNLDINFDSIDERRKFIFSYDMADKQKVFEQSLKQIQEKSSRKVLQSQKNMLDSTAKVKRDSKIQNNLLPPKQEYADVASLNKQFVTGVQKQDLMGMKFVGGYTRSKQILDRYKTDTMSTFRAQLKVSQMQYESNRIDYGIGVKTKRLIDNQIKQMRQQESEIQFKKNVEDDQKQQDSLGQFNEIKPNQLSTILSKQSKHKQITYLRVLTVLLLLACSGICITQFILIKQEQNAWLTQLTNIKTLNEMKTEVLCINFFVNYLCNYQGKDLITFDLFHQSINYLDRYLDDYLFGVNASLVYSDGSNDEYYLGFALNKYISQSNSLELTSSGLLNPKDTTTFFVQHNGLNGISVSMHEENQLTRNLLEVIILKLRQLYVIFIAVAVAYVFVVFTIKNILMKLLIRKKEQILQIFFEIPRVSCGMIQKQCEKFILMLSLENQEDDFQFISSGEELQDVGKKGKKIQKKRTVIGEQNATSYYLIASFFFIAILMIFQIYCFSFGTSKSQNMRIISKTSEEFFNIEFEIFRMAVYLESYSYDQSIPINNSFQHMTVINKTQQIVIGKLESIRKSYFNLKTIFDQSFDSIANKLLYESVCEIGETCDSNSTQVRDQNNGLNAVIQQFAGINKKRLKKSVQSLQTTHNPPNITQSDFLSAKMYQYSMKQHWRRLTQLIVDSIKNYMNTNNIWNLWMLVAVCVLNLVIVMFVALKYYLTLQQKIKATEYILTFIPIDEINKNKNIADYIKQQIMNRK